MGKPSSYFFQLPASGRPGDVALTEYWYPGIQAYWPKCTSSRIFDAIMGIKAVVIHATAGGSSEGAVSVMRDGHASFHWLVPDEDETAHGKNVWACAPEARAAWHVQNSKASPDINGGALKVNHWSLGIEVVNRETSEDGFSDWQVQATAQIVRHCWAKYPNLKWVTSHAKLDPTRRVDPGETFPWDRFKKLVLEGGADGLPRNVLKTTTAREIPRTRGGFGECCTG